MRLFDDARSRRLFNWGRAAALALPYDIMAGWLLKKSADGPKRHKRPRSRVQLLIFEQERVLGMSVCDFF
jgi:hypothetical protein